MAHTDALSRVTSDDDTVIESVDAKLPQHAYVFVAMSVQDGVCFMQQGDQYTRDRIRQLTETVETKTK